MLALAGWGIQRFLVRAGDYRRLEPEPVHLPFEIPFSGFVERGVAKLALEETARTMRERTTASTAPNRVAVSGPLETDRLKTASPTVKPTEDRILKAKLSRFAYIAYGSIGGEGLATFLDTRTKKTFAARAGAFVHGLRIESVSRDSVLLVTSEGSRIRKPRVELEVENKPMAELTADEKEARLIRYNELWGNPARFADVEEEPESNRNETDREIQAEKETARRNYIENMKHYRRKLERNDSGVDSRDSPGFPRVENVVDEENSP